MTDTYINVDDLTAGLLGVVFDVAFHSKKNATEAALTHGITSVVSRYISNMDGVESVLSPEHRNSIVVLACGVVSSIMKNRDLGKELFIFESVDLLAIHINEIFGFKKKFTEYYNNSIGPEQQTKTDDVKKTMSFY